MKLFQRAFSCLTAPVAAFAFDGSQAVTGGGFTGTHC